MKIQKVVGVTLALVASSCTEIVVDNIIKANYTVPASKLDKVVLGVGVIVVGGIAARAAYKYTEGEVKEFFDALEGLKKEFESKIFVKEIEKIS